jgi:hypothetical protein
VVEVLSKDGLEMMGCLVMDPQVELLGKELWVVGLAKLCFQCLHSLQPCIRHLIKIVSWCCLHYARHTQEKLSLKIYNFDTQTNFESTTVLDQKFITH